MKNNVEFKILLSPFEKNEEKSTNCNYLYLCKNQSTKRCLNRLCTLQ